MGAQVSASSLPPIPPLGTSHLALQAVIATRSFNARISVPAGLTQGMLQAQATLCASRCCPCLAGRSPCLAESPGQRHLRRHTALSAPGRPRGEWRAGLLDTPCSWDADLCSGPQGGQLLASWQ